MTTKHHQAPATTDATVRLDKWLWAARFYKTRSIAQDAIHGGIVHLNGHRVKAGKTVRQGDTITLRQGFDDKEVVVRQVSDKRRGAPEAQLLYEETAHSIAARAKAAEQRRLLKESHAPARPDKKQRRQLMRMRQEQDEG